MGQQISIPLRVGPNGRLVLVDQESDAGKAEQVAHLVSTRKGERVLDTDYGISDPAFARVEILEVIAGVEAYGPDVTVADVRSEDQGNGTQKVQVVLQ